MALHAKAKAEPEYRFDTLYDKLYRPDVLMHAYERSRANNGAAGVAGIAFEKIEQYGVLWWLWELAQTFGDERYAPQAITRVYIPKPN